MREGTGGDLLKAWCMLGVILPSLLDPPKLLV